MLPSIQPSTLARLSVSLESAARSDAVDVAKFARAVIIALLTLLSWENAAFAWP